MNSKVQGQTFVCNEAEAGLGCSRGAGEHLVTGTKLPCCCSLVPMPTRSFADASLDPAVSGLSLQLKSASAATTGNVPTDFGGPRAARCIHSCPSLLLAVTELDAAVTH